MDSLVALLVIFSIGILSIIILGGLIWYVRSWIITRKPQEFTIDQEVLSEPKPEPIKKLLFNNSDEKVASLLSKTADVINQHRPDVRELILFYGNLGYILGARIEGYEEKGPNLEQLKRQHYLNPTVGINLMLQGMTITSWEEDLKKEGKQ